MQGISKTLKFTLSLIVILGLAGYYIYYIFEKQPEAAGGIVVVEEADENIFGGDFREIATILSHLEFDTAFLSDPTFTSLKDFYRRPSSEEAGVSNPFTNL